MGAHLEQAESVSHSIPPVPPGFVPLTKFRLERVATQDAPGMGGAAGEGCTTSSLHSAEPQQTAQSGDVPCVSALDENKFKKSLRQRPWINYRQFDFSSDEEETESERLRNDGDLSSARCLPKGVLRGCSQCQHCQKVIARWRPEEASRPSIDDAPVFYPNEEEFKDTLKYIASIRPRAEPYGICRIVPPSSWKPPCPLKEANIWQNSKFTTRVQNLDKLQNRRSPKQMSGYRTVMRKKRQRLSKTEEKELDHEKHHRSENRSDCERFGFCPGPDFTLEAFKKYAEEFEEHYFGIISKKPDCGSNGQDEHKYWKPSVEDIEGEYWRMVENPTEEIEVLYGADLETKDFGSGFPKASSVSPISDLDNEYIKSGWNLNNLPRLQGSVLAFESGDISGVLIPWLYVGMCFSTFCWHVEDHHLYSLNYMHWGAPKMWYGVPGKDALKLEAAMKKHLPNLFEEQPDLLHNLVTQFSPSILKSEGVPVFRCIQHSGEFVLTFPRAYHAGFNCGFNCAEAVNVAPLDWLPHGQHAVELYRDQCRKISISHDKLLLGAAREAVRAQWRALFLRKDTPDSLLWKNACGQENVLARSLKARVEHERKKRDSFCCFGQIKKMDANFDANCERECFTCHYDLHLSAAGCQCSLDKFACLNHAKQMCSCDVSMKFFLFRYEISELNILVDALGGKLSAVHKWGMSDLGLSLSSYVSKDKPQEQSSANEISLDGQQKVKVHNSCSKPLNQRGSSPQENHKNIEAKQFLISERLCKKEIKSHTCEVKQGTPNLLSGKQEKIWVGNPHGTSTSVIVANPSTNPGKPACDSVMEENEPQIASETKCEEVNSFISSKDGIINGCLEEPAIVATADVSLHEHPKQVLDMRDINATMANEADAESILAAENTICPRNQISNIADQDNCPIFSWARSHLHDQSSSSSFSQKDPQDVKSASVNSSNHELPPSKEVLYNKFTNNVNISQNPIPGILKVNGENRPGKFGLHSFGRPGTDTLCNSGDNQQRGPRIAKVVRRINCSVELLRYGVVLSGKPWSTNQAIFPKGYRSRVRYFNIKNPSQMCYYISEILDAGLSWPLFMVQVEQCTSEIFIHVSPDRCWDMVRERVNHEIRCQHSLGKFNVPTLQPPGSIDGLDMFGLSSPAIIQAIEAMDQDHVCSEYWRSKTSCATPSLHLTSGSAEMVLRNPDYPTSRYDSLLSGLFKKANSEELKTLRHLLSDDKQESRTKLIELVDAEIKRRPKSDVSDNT